MTSDVIKFRDTEGLGESISRTRRRLGLSNDSTAVRLLLRQGEQRIDELIDHIWNVTQGLKLSEIDFFTSSLNVILKKKKREIMTKPAPSVARRSPRIVSQTRKGPSF